MRDRLRSLAKRSLEFVEAWTGPLESWRRHRDKTRELPSLRESMRSIERRWPECTQGRGDDPIFILAAGWRSGSTLLQRLVISSQEAFVWGEPYAHCDHIRQLAESLRVFRADYPPEHFFPDRMEASAHTGEWIANLYPAASRMVEAHRQFFQELYADPVHAAGYRRWGLKQVRLGIEHADYLDWLYSDAHFIFLYRNPYDAYRSYRRWRSWYDSWPEGPVFTPRRFGKHWRRLMDGFLTGAERPRRRLLRFEDLRADGTAVLADLSEFLDLPLSEKVLGERITHRGEQPKDPAPVPWAERRLLAKEVEPLAAELGYDGPSAVPGADEAPEEASAAEADGMEEVPAAAITGSASSGA